jgi:hypothetical protein
MNRIQRCAASSGASHQRDLVSGARLIPKVQAGDAGERRTCAPVFATTARAL